MKAALIGHGISASLTPPMHETEAGTQGFDYTYGRMDTALAPYDTMSLQNLLARAQSDGLAGVNITHPFKVEAAGLADELSDTARLLGAVNTMLFRDGRLIGHNTDYIGFRSALRARLPMAPIGRVLLIGAGGAGGAVGLALIDQGCETLSLFDRDRSAAEALARRLRSARPRVAVQVVGSFGDCDPARLNGVVNATPMGMDSHPGMAIDPTILGAACWVADIVYFPRETALLRAASERRLRVMDGSGMAVFQAAAAFHLITGRTASPERMAATLARLTQAEEIPA